MMKYMLISWSLFMAGVAQGQPMPVEDYIRIHSEVIDAYILERYTLGDTLGTVATKQVCKSMFEVTRDVYNKTGSFLQAQTYLQEALQDYFTTNYAVIRKRVNNRISDYIVKKYFEKEGIDPPDDL